MVIDLDAHQGDGHERDLGDDPEVFTVDLYGGENYPWAHDLKPKIEIDRPLPALVRDAVYLKVLDEALDEAFRRFQPELVLYVAGSDVPHVLGGACRRGVDEVFRAYTRGDEFVLLLHGLLPEPERFAAALLQRLRRRGVQASVGLAYTTETRYLPARVDLRIAAEAGCRKAKQCGGDCAWLVHEDVYGRLERLLRADESAAPSSAGASNVPRPIVDAGAARLERAQAATPLPAVLP